MLCLNDVGIRVHLKTLPTNEINERYYQNKAIDAMLIELPAKVRRPEEILGIWTQLEDAPAKAGGFDSPEAARLAANNPDTKKTLFREFDRLIADQQPGSFCSRKSISTPCPGGLR